jgi:glycosyltransferase 2 family protein
MTGRKWLLLTAGLCVSLIFLAIALVQVDWQILGQALTNINLALLALTVGLAALSILLRALRWTWITNGSSAGVGSFWAAATLGYLGNMIYPLRAGEALRILAINRLAKVPLSRAGTGALIDRISDGIMLGFVLLGLFVFHGAAVRGTQGIITLSLVFLLMALLLAGFGVWGRRWRPTLDRLLSRLPRDMGSRIMPWYDQAMFLVVEAGRPLAMARLLAVTMTVYCVDFAVAWSLMFAFGWSMPITAAITVEAFLAVGSLLPSGPGYVGTFQVASILALGLYGVDATSAVAFSFALQAVILLLVGMQSCWLVSRHGMRIARQ